MTFGSDRRQTLPGQVRSVVLECCLHDDGTKFDLRAAVVMPDHVPRLLTPSVKEKAFEIDSLAEIRDAVKGASAHAVKKVLGRKGRLWKPESFDPVLRCSENLDAKIVYPLENPVRAGLVSEWTQYPWWGPSPL